VSVTIRLWAFYELSADSTGATGLTVTVDVDKVAKANGAVTRVTTGGSAAEMANGVYSYAVANVADLDTYDYVGVFKTAATTVKSKHVPSLQQDLIAGLTTLMALVDVAVSTRLAAASYSAAPTSAANADAVWDELIAGHAIATSTGALLSSAGAAADPLLNAVPGAYVAPQAGYYLGRLANNQVQIKSNFDPDTMELSYYFGDDYKSADNREQTFTTDYTLTGGSVALEVRNATALVSIPCTIVDANTYALSLTAANLATITVGVWDYHLRMTLPTSADKITEVYGKIMVTADVR
jgi:hypothetical protein